MKTLALALVLVALIAGAVVLTLTGHNETAGVLGFFAIMVGVPFFAKALG